MLLAAGAIFRVGEPRNLLLHSEMRGARATGTARARALLRLCCCSSVVSAAFFPNPFADLLRQTPISVEKRNFALPRHPNLVTLNDALPVYEVPSFMSDVECDELIAATQSSQFPPIPYGTKNKIFTGTKWAAAGDPMVAPFMRQCCELFGVPETRFEPITITRYGEGQYQAQHLDARLNHQARDALETRAALLPAIRLHPADCSLRASHRWSGTSPTSRPAASASRRSSCPRGTRPNASLALTVRRGLCIR